MSLRVLAEIEVAVDALRASDRLFIETVKADLSTQLEQFVNMLRAADDALIVKMHSSGLSKLSFFEREMQRRGIDSNEIREIKLKAIEDMITSANDQFGANRKKIFERLEAKDDTTVAVISTNDALFADQITRMLINRAQRSADFSHSTFLKEAVEKRDETRQAGLQARRIKSAARRRLVSHKEEIANVHILKKLENDNASVTSSESD